jgi:phosphohistidine phosphatase
MKRLSLLRHAKTERESPTDRDFDRILTERGRKNAARMGKEIGELGLQYDLILTSPAARAVETAKRAGLHSAQRDERIYDASAGALVAIIQGVDDGVESLMMVGHNPGFERLASQLIGKNVEMPTGSLLELELPNDSWRDVGKVCGRPLRFLQPKELA